MTSKVNPATVRTGVAIVDAEGALEKRKQVPTVVAQAGSAESAGDPPMREPLWQGHWALVKHL